MVLSDAYSKNNYGACVCVFLFSLKKERITHGTHTYTHADYQ